MARGIQTIQLTLGNVADRLTPGTTSLRFARYGSPFLLRIAGPERDWPVISASVRNGILCAQFYFDFHTRRLKFLHSNQRPAPSQPNASRMQLAGLSVPCGEFGTRERETSPLRA